MGPATAQHNRRVTDSRPAKAAPTTTAIKSVVVSSKPRGPSRPGKPVTGSGQPGAEAARPDRRGQKPAARGSGNVRKVPTAKKRGPWGFVAILVVIAGLVGAGIWLHARQPSGPHAGDLRDYLVEVPGGATKSTDLPGKDGKLDVAAMQQQSSNPAGVKTVLDHYHFVGGAVTGWSTDKSRIQIMILRYGSATDATSAVTAFAAGEAGTLGPPTPVSGMTNGAVFATPIDAPTVYVSALGRNGDTVIVIHEYPTVATGLADAQKDATFVLTEQNARLS